MLSVPATLLLLGSAVLTLASPLAIQTRDFQQPYDLACVDSSRVTVYCAQSGLQCDPNSSATPDLTNAPRECKSCLCTQYPPRYDGDEPYVPQNVPNAVGPDGEECHAWNARVASNPAFAAEHPKVEPCVGTPSGLL